MPLTRFSKTAAMFDSTPIENLFLSEYMPIAPEGFVRVYLYMRMLGLHPEMDNGMEDIAKALRIDEAEVVNALAYWEQQGLVEQLSENPPVYELKSIYGGELQANAMDRDYYLYRDFNAALQNVFGSKENLEARHYRQANDWLNVMGMDQGAVIAILKYELKAFGGKKPESVFKRADKRIIALADAGIRGEKEVEAALALEERINALSAAVLERLGIYRNPSEEERACVRRWIEEWKLEEADVFAACGATTKSRAPSMADLDKSMYRYNAWLAKGFEAAAIRLAAAECAQRGAHDFNALEDLLRSWKEKDILTARQAEAHVGEARDIEAELRGVLENAKVEAHVADDELLRYADRYVEWKRSFSPEMIACAAELAKKTRAPLPYMDKVLANWQAKGVRTPQAAQSGGKPARRTGASGAAGEAPAKFNYQQHTYSEADFEAGFYRNNVRSEKEDEQ